MYNVILCVSFCKEASIYNKMICVKIFYFFVWVVKVKGDWVEIPLVSDPPKTTGPTYHAKTPINIVFSTEQIEEIDSHNTSIKSTTEVAPSRSNTNRILAKPSKSSIMEVFSGSTTTDFTPLMSSIVPQNYPTTTATPRRPRPAPKPTQPTPFSKPTEPTIMSIKTNAKRKKIEALKEDIEIEDEDDYVDEPERKVVKDSNLFSTYASFLPFLKSIQSTLMKKAHRSVKNKIKLLTDLRDNLLFDIDDKLRLLWSPNNGKQARGYKDEDDSHIEFPSNEGALMTIGFLTLAVFLVKLVLQVIHAIKQKKMYYNTTTTMATMVGRKKRNALPDMLPDIDTTYKILSSIDEFKYNFN